MEVNVISAPVVAKSRVKPILKKKAARAAAEKGDASEEERNYQKKAQWLKDHGDASSDEKSVEEAVDSDTE
jgi:hypothetical protein